MPRLVSDLAAATFLPPMLDVGMPQAPASSRASAGAQPLGDMAAQLFLSKVFSMPIAAMRATMAKRSLPETLGLHRPRAGSSCASTSASASSSLLHSMMDLHGPKATLARRPASVARCICALARFNFMQDPCLISCKVASNCNKSSSRSRSSSSASSIFFARFARSAIVLRNFARLKSLPGSLGAQLTEGAIMANALSLAHESRARP
mmetsp:Transcript_61900/g.178171  ORF Transcript_61900/g.178171 Transcript_61900/m.178171 type:complete len:207 (-) Transcript_61900:1-621(-)